MKSFIFSALIGFIVFVKLSHAQTTYVFVCSETGAAGYSYKNENNATYMAQLLKENARNNCINNGGTACKEVYSSSSEGWFAVSVCGTNGSIMYEVADSYKSKANAEEQSQKSCRLFYSDIKTSSWYVAESSAPQARYTAPKPDYGYPEYLQGLAAQRDKRYYSAIDWFMLAAEQGSDSAMYNLGNMYYKGQGSKKNDSLAMVWYRKAADNGIGEAMYSVGMLYYNGEGTAKNDVLAKEWMSKAAAKGMKDAEKALAQIAVANDNGITEYEKGVQAYELKQYADALSWMKKAADKGKHEAMFNLGVLYYKGEGVAKNDTTAYYWYSKAAEKGNTTSMYNLGYMFEHGISVKTDLNKALDWYSKAKNAGYAKAAEGIDRINKAKNNQGDDYME